MIFPFFPFEIDTNKHTDILNHMLSNCFSVCLLSGFSSLLLTHELTVMGASAEWLVLGFPPLLSGADGSPHSTPVGFPPRKTRKHKKINIIYGTGRCFLLEGKYNPYIPTGGTDEPKNSVLNIYETAWEGNFPKDSIPLYPIQVLFKKE